VGGVDLCFGGLFKKKIALTPCAVSNAWLAMQLTGEQPKTIERWEGAFLRTLEHFFSLLG
jgi:hypothetical protein